MTALAAMGLVSSCKPSEKNYRKAYDAAVAKRAVAAQDDELDFGRMIRDDLPRRERIETDSAYVRRESLVLFGDAPASFELCNVAVSAFQMRTNAQAMANRLKNEGMDAFVLESSGGTLYVIAASRSNLREAVKWMREFISAHPEFTYVGLPGEPVIEIPLGKR